jgi:hypothetical protein
MRQGCFYLLSRWKISVDDLVPQPLSSGQDLESYERFTTEDHDDVIADLYKVPKPGKNSDSEMELDEPLH